ncbi:Predicted P-loop ATPase fused to an acetyltransferase [Ceraceosorus bombacis]|uniref:RNA cytidine acetyltransferase n=1 Tax=Ceraceosorus bombacis TaxID=401625 RepID=A0A0P1BKJ1_9BASI|nr:Predicted P-loop ATPase fused to an acetyltransferase [Ceraceosorus bombacis]
MRKQLDPRIAALIRSSIHTSHRSFVVLVGDHSRDQIVNLHFLLSQSRTTARPSVLWCYKSDLGFTTHRKKREAKIKRDMQRGIRDKDANNMTPFELFIGVTEIRYCYYKETEKILGNTFGMLVLQDFEAVTPNILARTIETVEGGGVVVLMLKTMTSLRQLYGAAMDVHKSYRSSFDSAEPVARFNERFLLSLAACNRALFLDDELNVLPVSRGRDISIEASSTAPGALKSKSEQELEWIKAETKSTPVVGDVVRHCKTRDQAKVVLTILDILSSSQLSTTVALTAGRGRGKSAALGLCIAAAVVHGYSNIFVTSPAPSNLKTLFEFLFKGLAALGYEEVSDWSVQKGVKEFKDHVVRVNIFKHHRQTIQYIDPNDNNTLGQAELVVVDEAAAIPLPVLKRLLGPYLVFLSSTINGYEGTGRSLSLKLLQQLRGGGNAHQNQDTDAAALVRNSSKDASSRITGKALSAEGAAGMSTIRSLKEVQLNEPIRYAGGDAVERWLHELLCLDASLTPLSAHSSPHPSSCQLYGVNRDALFSYHAASEVFLQRIMALYVAAHYKNSPNDLQLMSDAPAHRLFVLLGPSDKTQKQQLPEPLAVMQVALEGNISNEIIMRSLARGQREAGDLIPWLIAQQYQDDEFAGLSGARIVRVAVHPDHAGAGYGTRAVELLREFYKGGLLDADALARRQANASAQARDEETFEKIRDDALLGANDASISIRDAHRMPALLERLEERRPERLDWIGVSFGHTPALFRFWKRAGYVPLYVRQQASELTGEHSTLMLRGLEVQQQQEGQVQQEQGPEWLSAFASDFVRRFISLLAGRFRALDCVPALAVLEAASSASNDSKADRLTLQELRVHFSPFDIKRLEAYSNSMIELPTILDLLPALASLYFTRRLQAVAEGIGSEEGPRGEERTRTGTKMLELGALQSSLLLAVALQKKDLEELQSEIGLMKNQTNALMLKAVRKMLGSVKMVEEQEVARKMGLRALQSGKGANGAFEPLRRDVQQDFEEAEQTGDDGEGDGDEKKEEEEEEEEEEPAQSALDRKEFAAKQALPRALEKYAIDKEGRDWTDAEAQVQRAIALGTSASASTTEQGRSGKAQTIVSVKGAPAPASFSYTGKEQRSNGGKKRREDNGGDKKSKKTKRR